MTAEEAIRILDNLFSKIANFGCYATDEELDAIFVAKEALEKLMIKKKPTFVDIRFRNHGRNISDGSSLCKCYKCPNCGLHIFNVFNEEHCHHCGQALDWTE